MVVIAVNMAIINAINVLIASLSWKKSGWFVIKDVWVTMLLIVVATWVLLGNAIVTFITSALEIRICKQYITNTMIIKRIMLCNNEFGIRIVKLLISGGFDIVVR